MRLIVAILLTLSVGLTLPSAPSADEVVASRAAPVASANPSGAASEEGMMSLAAKEIVVGTVALGCAFVVGFAAGGGLAAGFAAASLLAVGYAVLP
jgi:hypothetical protein